MSDTHIDLIMDVISNHAFSGQFWTGKDGYTAECKCGYSVLVGNIPEKEDPPISQREQELYAKIDSLTGNEEREYLELNKRSRELRDAIYAENIATAKAAVRSAISKHIRAILTEKLYAPVQP